MSSNENGNGDDDGSNQGGAGRREVAWRVFAAEYDDATLSHSESDEERAPNYVITPTGARINRLFVVGVLTQVEEVSDDVLRGRIVDPTGAFVVYAGQYQPDEMAFLESADPPAFVAVTGKARTFQPDDSDRVFTSVRPESINRVDAETRDRWVVQTAEQTLRRVSTFADALELDQRGDALRELLERQGVDDGLAAGIPLAVDHYGTTPGYLAAVWDLSLDAARVVAGEINADEVGPLDLAPDEGGDAAGVAFDYSLVDLESEADVGDVGADAEEATAESEPSDELSPESDTPPAESRTEVGETEATSEASAEPEPTESVDAEAAETETAETAEPTDTAQSSEPADPTESADAAAAGDELGDAPSSSLDEESTDTTSVEDADDAADFQEELDDDESPTVEAERETTTDESFEPETETETDLGTGDVGDEMYEFDEDEREQIEEEHGLEFSSGSDVSDPGEADIESPEAETAETESAGAASDDLEDFEPAAESPSEPDVDVESGPASEEEAEPEPETEPEAEPEPAETEESGGEEPEDLEDAVMDAMRELDDGDGVGREELLAAVVQEYDVGPADVEDALQAALLDGRCYESGEDTLKPI